MPDALKLTEYGSADVSLTPFQAETLASRFGKELQLELRPGGLFRIRASHFVGTYVLPDLELRVVPKCPMQTLMLLLGYAYDLVDLRVELAAYTETDDLWDFLVGLFVGKVEGLLRRGVRRGYVEREEEVRAIRGRLLVERLIRRPMSSDLVVPCEFEDLTADVPHNQVIRFTLERLHVRRSPEMLRRLHRLRKAFRFASARTFAPQDLERFTYDRLSAAYEPIHRICRVLLELRGLDEGSGGHALASWSADMNKLFERFVTAWLRENLRDGWQLIGQGYGSLDVQGDVRFRPDLLFRRGKRYCLVADTKYKLTGDAARPPAEVVSRAIPAEPGDLYQMVAYCRGLGVRRAVLIYPDWSREPVRLQVQDGETEVFLDGVDLRGSPAEVEASMKALLDRLLQRAAISPPALAAAS